MSAHRTNPQAGPTSTKVLIIGTGFSGMGMAIALQKEGVDFLILEKATDFGGTWRDNVYPGVACDVPAHLYSFSFEPKSDWSRLWAPGSEIQDYLLGIARKYRLENHTVFNSKLARAEWSETECRWHAFTEDGREFVAQFVVSGVGALHIPSVPDVPGREVFQGQQFHTSEWDKNVNLTGKRVAVVGTGASAIQVVPAIMKDVDELTLYQRTPAWVVTRPDFAIPRPVQLGFKYVPGLRLGARLGIHAWQEFIGSGMTKHMQLLRIFEAVARLHLLQVRDPDLRAKLTPNYTIGCKRIGFAVGFYDAMNDPKANAVTDPIVRISGKTLVTKDGAGVETEHEVDVIIWATGFHVTDSFRYMGSIKGSGGEDLVDRWNETGMVAHRGITIEGMPNLFFLLGPNTGLGHNSVVIMIEAQIRYAIQAIKATEKLGVDALAPTKEAQATYNEWIQERLSHTVQNTGGCMSWYIDEYGNNRVLWPGHTGEYRQAVRKFNPSEYEYYQTTHH